METIYIKSISFIGENRKNKRKVKVKLSNKTTITIKSCYESWQQYGGTQDELWITVPIAEKYNEWLHGGEKDL